MAPPVAMAMADSQVLQMAAATLALGPDVFQRGVGGADVLAADPAGHLSMQLPGDGVVNLGAGQGEAAHACVVSAGLFSYGRLGLPGDDVPSVIPASHFNLGWQP